MPLRDHFRPPLDNKHSWEGFHAQWPAVIVQHLRKRLPAGYVAEPHLHAGSQVEIDIAAFETDEPPSGYDPSEGNGGVATAVWAPPRPSVAVETTLPDYDEFEVRIYDTKRGRHLVAAIEIVSPANKDRAEHRRAFVAKCAGLLRERVSVVIVDVVTTRTQSLYEELLDQIGQSDPSLSPAPPLYTAACRLTKQGSDWLLETWAQSLSVGGPLPTVPLWLADDLAVPLELDESYAQSCSILNIP